MKNLLQHSILFTVVFSILCGFSSSAQLLSQQDETNRPDTLQPGTQGSINPLTDNTPVYTGDDLLDASFPNSWPIFGSGVRMSIGGYVKGDVIRDLDYIGDIYEFELGSIAVEGSPERDLGGTTTLHAKQSRVNFDFRSKSTWRNGKEFPMQVFVEFDWFFDSPSMRNQTRLRHAYGVIGRLLVGRTWTNSGDLSTLPGTIDFAAGDALYGGRVAQIRWQDKINDRWRYTVAIEEAPGQIDNPQNLAGAFRPLWPKVAGNIKWRSANGSSIQLGGDLFPISWAGPDSVPNVSKVGYSVVLNGRVVFKTTAFKDAFVWGAGIGEGLGHQIIALSWDGRASGVVTQNDLTLSPAWYGYAGYNHYWSKSLNSNISTAWAGTTLSPIQSENLIQQAGSFHINLIWFPYKLISTGIEYMWGVRKNNNGIEGTASRIQFMVKFKFN